MSSNIELETVDYILSLTAERDRLREVLQGSTDLVRPLIEGAISNADEKISQLESDPGIRGALHKIGAMAVRSLQEIDDLSGAVDLGLVSGGDLDAKREEILSNPRVSFAVDFIKRIGVVDELTVVDCVPEAPNYRDASSPETISYPEIVITVQDKGIKIGDRGKFIRLTGVSESDETRRDYSEERVAVLKTLVENAGQGYMAVSELWQKTFPDRDFDQKTFTQIEVWLSKLTFRRSSIVAHNGSRGAQSAYHIPNPGVSLIATQKATSSSGSSNEMMERVVGGDSTLVATAGVGHGVRSGEEVQLPATVGSEAKTKAIEIHFPLNQVQSTVLASFLSQNRSVMESMGLQAIDTEYVSWIEEVLEASKLQEELQAQGGDLIELRKLAIDEISQYFKSESLVLSDITAMSELDSRYGLFEYLFELEDEDRDVLLKSMVEATPVVTVMTEGASWSSAEFVTSVEPALVSHGGQVLPSSKGHGSDGVSSFTFDDDDGLIHEEEVGSEPPRHQPIVDSRPKGPESDQDTPSLDVFVVNTASVEPPAPENGDDKKEKEWITSFKSSLEEAIEIFQADGLMDTRVILSSTINIKSSSNRMATDEMFSRGLSNKIITKSQAKARRGELSLPLDTWLCLILQNTHSQDFGNARRRKTLFKIVKSRLDDYFSAE